MSKSRILLLLLATSLGLLLYVANAQPPTKPNLVGNMCDNNPDVIPTDEHALNVKTLIEDLKKKAFQFLSYNSSTGSGENMVYGQYYCRGDIDSTLCGQCVEDASLDSCLSTYASLYATIIYQECTLRYDNDSMLGIPDVHLESPTAYASPYLTSSPFNVTDTEKFGSVLTNTLDNIMHKAAYGHGSLGFATAEGLVSDNETVYCLVQCSPDLNGIECMTCLRASYEHFIPFHGNSWVREQDLFFPSCQMRYSNYGIFYYRLLNAPPPNETTTATVKEIKPKKASKYVLRVVVPAVLVGLLATVVISFCLFGRKRLWATTSGRQATKIATERGIQTAECVQFDLQSIESATNSFSLSNKLGQGGFGIVYQGKLNNGQTVAVKRLSTGSGQGSNEFKTEVAVLAKLQHKNLVQLVGFCVDGDERLLVYEFLSNLSLDRFLFDPIKSASLTWPIRYNIIKGIVRGLHYLHEDSRVKIVHRDLKISNVLLDDNLDPKIADFGLAKLVKVDQTTANTSKVVGTYGYMSPEYALAGRYSTKSDMYSFGVIVLEILSGKNNSLFYDMSLNEGLLQHAWRVCNEGKIEELMDPIMQNNYSRTEAERCLEIGLLCIQDDALCRPTMNAVLAMLNRNIIDLPPPRCPTNYNMVSSDDETQERTSKEE